MEDKPAEYEFDSNAIRVEDLDGYVYQINVSKALGNICFMYFNTIEWDDIARKIHKGEIAIMTKTELEQLGQLVRSPQVQMMIAVRSAINSYILNLLESDGIRTEKVRIEENVNQ